MQARSLNLVESRQEMVRLTNAITSILDKATLNSQQFQQNLTAVDELLASFKSSFLSAEEKLECLSTQIAFIDGQSAHWTLGHWLAYFLSEQHDSMHITAVQNAMMRYLELITPLCLQVSPFRALDFLQRRGYSGYTLGILIATGSFPVITLQFIKLIQALAVTSPAIAIEILRAVISPSNYYTMFQAVFISPMTAEMNYSPNGELANSYLSLLEELANAVPMEVLNFLKIQGSKGSNVGYSIAMVGDIALRRRYLKLLHTLAAIDHEKVAQLLALSNKDGSTIGNILACNTITSDPAAHTILLKQLTNQVATADQLSILNLANHEGLVRRYAAGVCVDPRGVKKRLEELILIRAEDSSDEAIIQIKIRLLLEAIFILQSLLGGNLHVKLDLGRVDLNSERIVELRKNLIAHLTPARTIQALRDIVQSYTTLEQEQEKNQLLAALLFAYLATSDFRDALSVLQAFTTLTFPAWRKGHKEDEYNAFYFIRSQISMGRIMMGAQLMGDAKNWLRDLLIFNGNETPTEKAIKALVILQAVYLPTSLFYHLLRFERYLGGKFDINSGRFKELQLSLKAAAVDPAIAEIKRSFFATNNIAEVSVEESTGLLSAASSLVFKAKKPKTPKPTAPAASLSAVDAAAVSSASVAAAASPSALWFKSPAKKAAAQELELQQFKL
jgi:hypothetical protein